MSPNHRNETSASHPTPQREKKGNRRPASRPLLAEIQSLPDPSTRRDNPRPMDNQASAHPTAPPPLPNLGPRQLAATRLDPRPTHFPGTRGYGGTPGAPRAGLSESRPCPSPVSPPPRQAPSSNIPILLVASRNVSLPGASCVGGTRYASRAPWATWTNPVQAPRLRGHCSSVADERMPANRRSHPPRSVPRRGDREARGCPQPQRSSPGGVAAAEPSILPGTV